MADVNKSVAINYSASTEQLERALKKIPGITDKEATKAAGELDKNFKKMESSADKTSKSVSK
jgi:Holliday junction resolvasome RuvABC DNA-binding subunit